MADPEVIIDFEPDWGVEPEIGYGFQTVIQTTPRLIEQRRPLLSTPERTVNCEFKLVEENLQRALILLQYGSDKICCVPIYSEPIFSDAFSGVSITATTTLTYLWNIQNCSYAVLIDWITGQSEMLSVSGVAGQVISLSSSIVESWTASQTVLYPAMPAVLSEFKSSDITDRVGTIEVGFTEIVEDSGDATEEAVELVDRVCLGNSTWTDILDGNDDAQFMRSAYYWSKVNQVIPVGVISSETHGIFRYPHVYWNKGWEITTATFRWCCAQNNTASPTRTVNWRIFAVADDNPVMPPDTWEGYESLRTNLTTNYVTYSGATDSKVIGTNYESPNIKSVIDEVISRAGWVAGNSIILYMENTPGDANDAYWNVRSNEGYIALGGTPPRLIIE